MLPKSKKIRIVAVLVALAMVAIVAAPVFADGTLSVSNSGMGNIQSDVYNAPAGKDIVSFSRTDVVSVEGGTRLTRLSAPEQIN